MLVRVGRGRRGRIGRGGWIGGWRSGVDGVDIRDGGPGFDGRGEKDDAGGFGLGK